MNVLITGTSGMVGKAAMIECLEDSRIDRVLIVNRTSIRWKHNKLKEIVLSDYRLLEEFKDEIKDIDSCLFCAGVSSAGLSESDYSRLTYDLTIQFAETFLEANPGSQFVYVSGTGTDSTEKGRVMWARVKGKTENKLLDMNFSNAYMFRPGYIQPVKGVETKTKLYKVFYLILKPLYPIFKHLSKSIIDSSMLGKAMICVLLSGNENSIIEANQINDIYKKYEENK